MTRYDKFVARKSREHGPRFSTADLEPVFIPYYNSRERVRVQFLDGEEMTGTIGVTTGWRPAFLLLRRSSDMSSPWVLSARQHVVAVKRGRKYVEVSA